MINNIRHKRKGMGHITTPILIWGRGLGSIIQYVAYDKDQYVMDGIYGINKIRYDN